MKHLFVLDPIEKLNLKLDSSLRLCGALTALGEEVFICEVKDLFWRRGDIAAHVMGRQLTFTRLNDVASHHIGDEKEYSLGDFQAVHMRKDPPIDMGYITATWLLQSAPPATKIYNDPSELRGFNEKLGIFEFPQACRAAILTNDVDRLFDFLEKEANGDAILKPLGFHGGRGVIRLSLAEQSKTQIREILRHETERGISWRVMQPFDAKIFEGEVRAFAVGGEIISWCLKVPAKGNYLANTAAGARLEVFEPTEDLRGRIEAVAGSLHRRGIFFVGFDIIGGYISEINITSPRLLQAPGDLSDYYPMIAELVCKDLRKFS